MRPGRKPQFGLVALTGAEKARRWRAKRDAPKIAAREAERERVAAKKRKRHQRQSLVNKA
jgi:hypothetical protein